ncbi:MAG: toprim domain-containing protein [Tenuifilaceae bacterium]
MASQRKNNQPSLIIKSIPILDIISKFICAKPERIKGDDYWYISFIRPQEKVPSLKVNAKKNIWYDFGLGDGGNCLDLLIYYLKTNDIIYIAKTIKNHFPDYFFLDQPVLTRSNDQLADKPKNEIAKIIPLEHAALINYVAFRAISLKLANRYCQEVWYRNTGKNYFAVGFKSDSGYELRNKFFQGCTGKGITFIDNGSNDCTVFEGFFSWLSLLELNPDVEFNMNHLILNSISNYSKAEELLKKHDLLRLYLDLDDSGRSVVSKIDKIGIKYKDESELYNGFNDLNEYLVYLRRST